MFRNFRMNRFRVTLVMLFKVNIKIITKDITYILNPQIILKVQEWDFLCDVLKKKQMWHAFRGFILIGSFCSIHNIWGHGVSQMFKQHLEVTKYLPQNINPNPNPIQTIDFTQLDVAYWRSAAMRFHKKSKWKTGTFQNTKSAKQALNKYI